MKSERVTPANLILVVIIVLLCAVIGFQYLTIKELRKTRPIAVSAQLFPDLELVGVDNSRLSTEHFAKKIYLLFIFKDGCMECSQNLIAWRNVASFFNHKIQVAGIIPDGNLSGLQFQMDKKPNFPLYIPSEVQHFAAKLHLDCSIENTMVVYDKKIIAVKGGQLSGKDINSLLQLIQKIIKNQEEVNG